MHIRIALDSFVKRMYVIKVQRKIVTRRTSASPCIIEELNFAF